MITKEISKQQIKDKLYKHSLWLNDMPGGKRADFENTYLAEREFIGIDLALAIFEGANLVRANFKNVHLKSAIFDKADLSFANLERTDLSYTRFVNANLIGTNFANANLYCAEFIGANLRSAYGIIGIGPGGSRGDFVYGVMHSDCLMIKCGCFWGSIELFSKAVREKHGKTVYGMYYRNVITFLRKWYEFNKESIQNKEGEA